MTAFLTHFDYIETYRKFRDEFMQEPFSPNSAVFKHCDGKRNKIRWLKVHITIRLPMSCQTNGLIWNYEVLKLPESHVS
jgi:hypothetical protein